MSTHAWQAARPVPDAMTAVTFREFGEPDVLLPEKVPTPEPGLGEVLVQVRAVSVGRLLDLVARSGRHPYAKFTFPHVLGAEHSGVVAAFGLGVSGFDVGDRVAVFPVVNPVEDDLTRAGYPDLSPALQIIGTHRPGAYAEYCVVPAVNVHRVPDDMGPVEAVAVALAGAVAMNQLDRVGFRPGHRVVVQGASSALGSTTALLAKHLGADVLVTSRFEEKRERLRALGFSHVLDATHPEFPAMTLEAFGGKEADIVVDDLGDPTIWSNGMDVLAAGGAIVSSGAFLGREVTVNLQRLYSRGQRVVGVRTGTPDSARRMWEEAARGFRSVSDRTFSLTEAALAHRYVEGSASLGRVSLVVG
jgi:NADPH:quinone reductase-like Zn-dependent oxidoreductase